MPKYSQEYSQRKMKAVDAINKEVDVIKGIKAAGGKVRGNEPKMTLRGLRTLLVSEDSLFADLVDGFESGEFNAKQLASKIRSRTEKIGKDEVIIHSDTIHHGNPLELADALDQMESGELADLLTEQYEVHGQTYGDTRQNVRGQSYTTRGHLAQSANPRGRYKATNEFSEPGVTEISAHPRGPNDPKMKAPKVKPTTRQEAQEFLTSKQPLVEESVQLGSFADKDVRALADQKVTERGIILPGDTLYRSDLPDETLQSARKSLDNISDEIDLAKAFKTPSKLGMRRRMIQGLSLTSAAALGTFGTAADAYETYERTKLAAETNDPIDKLQAGISATSTITGATGVGEVIGLPLEATNILIDQYRSGGAAPMAGRSGQKLIERKEAQQRRLTIQPQPQTRRMGRGAAKRRQKEEE